MVCEENEKEILITVSFQERGKISCNNNPTIRIFVCASATVGQPS